METQSRASACPCGETLPIQTGSGRRRTYCSTACSRYYHALGYRTSHRQVSVSPADVPQLSAYEYAQLLVAQANQCAICRREETSTGKFGKAKRLAIDHCHKTGKLRGLLCQACNSAIGLMGDDIGRLLAAAQYIAQHAPSGDAMLTSSY